MLKIWQLFTLRLYYYVCLIHEIKNLLLIPVKPPQILPSLLLQVSPTVMIVSLQEHIRFWQQWQSFTTARVTTACMNLEFVPRWYICENGLKCWGFFVKLSISFMHYIHSLYHHHDTSMGNYGRRFYPYIGRDSRTTAQHSQPWWGFEGDAEGAWLAGLVLSPGKFKMAISC